MFGRWNSSRWRTRGRYSINAVHNMDLQRVQIWQNFFTFWTGVYWDIPLFWPFLTTSSCKQRRYIITCYITSFFFPLILCNGWKRTDLLLKIRESHSLQLPRIATEEVGSCLLTSKGVLNWTQLDLALWAGGCLQYLFGQGEVSAPDLVPWLRGDSASLPKSFWGEMGQLLKSALKTKYN